MRLKPVIFHTILLSILLAISFGSLNAQRNAGKDKAELLYKLPKYFNWKIGNENIKVAVIGGEKDVIKQLSRLSKKRYPYGRSIEATFFLQPKDLINFEDAFHLIYAGNEFTEQMPAVLQHAKVTGGVLVSDGWDAHKSLMVNFITKDGKINFEYNIRNLEENGISVSNDLKKTDAVLIDDRSLYEESEKNLLKEKEKVRAQREELRLQELKLAYQLKRIKKQTERIEKHQEEIEKQQRRISEQKKELTLLMIQAKEQNKQLAAATSVLEEKERAIEEQTKKLKEQQAETDRQKSILEKQKQEIAERQKKIRDQKLEIAAQTGIIRTQKNAITIFSVLLGIILILVFFILRSYRVQKKQNKLLAEQKDEIERQAKQMEEINKELAKLSIVASETSNAVAILDQKGRFEWLNAGYTRMHGYTLQLLRHEVGNSLKDVSSHPQTEEIVQKSIDQKSAVSFESEARTRNGQKIWTQTTITPTLNAFGEVDKLVLIDTDITDIKEAEAEIANKNKQITRSIIYAERIQRAVLTPKEIIKQYLPEHFIMFRPRDIVSGDFYWAAEKDGVLIVTAADCTGHGVPGAFMSMLGISFLNQIIAEHPVEELKSNIVLDELREKVKTSLRQTGKEGEAKDGMDMALCIIDKPNMQMDFAGAQNPLVLIRDGEVHRYKGNDMPIGISYRERPFTNTEFEMKKGDSYYIFSDGYPDQFGQKTKKKFYSKRLRMVFQKINDKSMQEQGDYLEETFDKWKGNRTQMDDVLVIGMRI